MYPSIRIAAAVVGAALLSAPVHAHGVAGAHQFVNTMLLDDPNVADEASLPTMTYLPVYNDGGGITNQTTAGIEIDKRITENFGIGVNTGYTWLQTPGQKTANGWQNLSVTAKYKAFVSDEHEFMLSAGIIRNFARTGANGTNGANIGNADSSATTPTLYFGKGFGDLPIGPLRAFAVTGTLGYQIPDKRLKVDTGGSALNNGLSAQWQGGLSLQYSLRYLQSQVKDLGLPEFVNKLTPLVEVAWSSPASKPNNGATQYLIGAGIAYTESTYAVTVEALFPGNRQSGAHTGIVAQFHLYFDDLLPNSLGKPVTKWW